MSVSIHYTPIKSKTYLHLANSSIVALENAFGKMPIVILYENETDMNVLGGMAIVYGLGGNNPYSELADAICTFGGITIDKEH